MVESEEFNRCLIDNNNKKKKILQMGNQPIEMCFCCVEKNLQKVNFILFLFIYLFIMKPKITDYKTIMESWNSCLK